MRIRFNFKDESGVILMASTMGVFIILSLFAFYLARFSVIESRTGVITPKISRLGISL